MVDQHRQRFFADPGDDRAFEALEEHFFLAGRWEELITHYEHRLTAPPERLGHRQRADVLFRLGQIWEERIGQPDRAADYYRQALRADSGYRPALRHLRHLHCLRQQWEVALQIAEVEAALPMRSDERAALLAEVGGLWLHRLGDADQAIQWFERSLAERGDCGEALEGAARALTRQGRSIEASRSWRKRIAQLRGPARASALVELARLTAGRLANAEAAAQLYQDALSEEPMNRDAIEGLAAYAELAGRWPLLADLYGRQFQLETESGRRASIASELGRLHLEHLNDAESAEQWLCRAAELAPDSAAVQQGLADCERARGSEEGVLTHVERLIELRGADAPVSALLEAASLRSERGDDERALGYLEHALGRTPDDALVVEALAETLQRLGRFEALVDVLERRAELVGSDGETRAAALAELGQVQQQLNDDEAALGAFQRAFHADPAAPGVAATLEQLYRKAEDLPGLRGLLEAAGRSGPREERVSYLCALGTLCADTDGDREAARRAFERALELQPACRTAHAWLQEDAAAGGNEAALLEALAREAQVSADAARLESLVPRMLELLEKTGQPEEALAWAERWAQRSPEDPRALLAEADLLERLGREAELLLALERTEPLLDPAEQAGVQRRMAALHLGAGRHDEAAHTWRRALARDPEDLESLEGLAAALDRADRPEEREPVLARLAELSPPSRRARLLEELAALRADSLGDLGGAIEALTELCAAPEAPADAETRLDDLLEQAGRYDPLAQRLRARLAEGGSGQRDGWLRLGELYLERLERLDAAGEAFRNALSEDPGCQEAWLGLERGVRAAGDPVALAELLAERAAAEGDGEPWQLERARVLDQQCGDAEGALSAYGELLDSPDPERAEQAAAGVEDLLERAGAFASLREHLEARLPRVSPDDRADLHERLAWLCRDRLGDPDGASHHLESAVALDPGRADWWDALAADYAAAERGADLVRALEGELATGPPPEREVVLRSRAAEVCAGALGDAEHARAHAERVLELDPTHAGAAEFLIGHWERGGNPHAVVRLLENRLSGLSADADPAQDDPRRGERVSLRLRIAGLRAGPLNDLDGAIAALEPALGELGPSAAVAEPLADLYQRAGYSEDLLELCRMAADSAAEPGERVDWFLRLGDALRERRQDREAGEAYQRVLSDRPEERRAQAALRDLYRSQREAEPLARLLEMQLVHATGAEELAARSELAELLAGPLGRPEEALRQLQRVLQVESGRLDALESALALAEDQGQGELALELIEQRLCCEMRAAGRAGWLARRARLRARGHAFEEAAVDYREALRLDPACGVRPELRSVLESAGRWDGVLECLGEEAYRAAPEARIALLERAAQVASAHGPADASLPWLARLRAERPDDPTLVARVAELHRRAGRTGALLRALDQQSGLVDDSQEWRALQLERASLLAPDSPRGAAGVLEAVRELFPRDADVLGQLEGLYRDAGRVAERVDVLEALIGTQPEEGRVALHAEVASLCSDALSDPRRAARHLLLAVSLAPRRGLRYAELLRALGGALRRAGTGDAWARCAEAELLALDEDAAVFDDRRRELQRELARIYERELVRPDDALRHLRALSHSLEATGAATPKELEEAEGALLRLLRARSCWLELEQRLAGRLARLPDDPEGWLELARLRDERLREPAGAAEAYRKVLELEADCLPALRGLRAAAERLGDFSLLAHTLERELEHPQIGSPAERSALLRSLGHVCWERLEETTRASRAYASALEVSPRDFESLRSLEQLLEAMEDWRGATDLYESEVEVLGDAEAERRREAWLRAAELAHEHLDDPARAIRAYTQAGVLGSLEPRARAQLAELHLTVGDLEAHTLVLAEWCDDPEAGARSQDHLRLAGALEQLGRPDAAARRVDRVLEQDPGSLEAWDVAARLRAAAGDLDGAAEALSRGAEAISGPEAAGRLLHAAELLEGREAGRSAQLLRAAAAHDTGSAPVQLALARVTLGLGQSAEAEAAATRSLDLLPDASPGSAEVGAAQLEASLLAGRAALAQQRLEPAVSYFARALSLEPEHPEALAGSGEALFELGDLQGARRALEQRLTVGEPDLARAAHLAIIGAGLEAEGELDAAVQRLEEALREDPGLDGAHERLVALHERADRIDEGVASLERWADSAREPAQFAARLVRAANWELRAGGREDAAERHLRDALDADPAPPGPWQSLALLLWERGRADEALDVATRAGEGVEDPQVRSTLALVRARALEKRGDRGPAADAFGEAVAGDPRCAEAALARARLLRGLGEWREAAQSLQEFADRHPGDPPGPLAEALEQLGRLLAGPLEEVDRAVTVYRRAIALDPARPATRAALAELLSHRPGDWEEAKGLCHSLLTARPTELRILRVVQRAAGSRGDEPARRAGLRVLRALGVATATEREEPLGDSLPGLAGRRELVDALWEKIRRVAVEASGEIAEALQVAGSPLLAGGAAASAGLPTAGLAAEAELIGPALVPLPDEELGRLLSLVAALALDPEHVHGDGQLVNALTAALGRRKLRRLRTILEGESLATIEHLDFAAWRIEVRALAAALALDAASADLRAGLVTALADASDRDAAELASHQDLTALVDSCPPARALLRRAVHAWLETL